MKSIIDMKPAEYDVVQLLTPLPEHDLPTGSTGTVLIDHTKQSGSTALPAYEVEFTDDMGNTLAVATVPENALRVVWRPSDERE
jgi:Domain of unknown function (DUF4926)